MCWRRKMGAALTPPLAGFTDKGRAREARSVAGILGQRWVGVDLGLRNRKPLLEVWKGLPGAADGGVGIRVVPLQAVAPEPRLARVAAHQVKPALRLEREFPRAFHVDRIAHRRLIHRLARGAVVVGLRPVLGARSLARTRADHF